MKHIGKKPNTSGYFFLLISAYIVKELLGFYAHQSLHIKRGSIDRYLNETLSIKQNVTQCVDKVYLPFSVSRELAY